VHGRALQFPGPGAVELQFMGPVAVELQCTAVHSSALNCTELQCTGVPAWLKLSYYHSTIVLQYIAIYCNCIDRGTGKVLQ